MLQFIAKRCASTRVLCTDPKQYPYQFKESKFENLKVTKELDEKLCTYLTWSYANRIIMDYLNVVLGLNLGRIPPKLGEELESMRDLRRKILICVSTVHEV